MNILIIFLFVSFLLGLIFEFINKSSNWKDLYTPFKKASVGVFLLSVGLLIYFISSDSGVRFSVNFLYILSRTVILFVVLLLPSLLGVLAAILLGKISLTQKNRVS